MQPVDFSGFLIFCPFNQLNHLPPIVSNFKKTIENDVCIFSTSHMDESLHSDLLQMKNLETRRYLDRFYICMPVDFEKKQKLLNVFFDLIGKDYESLIDIDQNTDNIINLLKLLTKNPKINKNSVILDYGCGTGISFQIAKNFNINLMGMDKSSIMQQISLSKKMPLISIDEFSKNPFPLDGIISSYTLHLESSSHDLLLLSEMLNKGCSILANFHKHLGVDSITTTLSKNFKKYSRVVSSPFSHGDYYEFVKE